MASAVAGSVTELERALEADLLIRRRGRGVSLTPTGTEVLGRAKLLLTGPPSSTTWPAVSRTADGPTGNRCSVRLRARCFPRCFADVRGRHPQVTIDFVEGSQDELERDLLAGELDVAVMYDMDLTATWTASCSTRPAYALFGAGHPLAASRR